MFENLRDFWARTAPGARTGLVVGVLAIAAAVLWIGSTLLRTNTQVLFADLEPADAAAIVSELDRMKVPYDLSADERTILVSEHLVHTTRLKLMGEGVNLKGGVGLELFNNTDFGMTEFAQKVNYQRALQGELTRTIGALDEVRSVRVHLVMPEAGLFKKSGQKPKASITLTLKPGRTLQPEQVTGIQRLVAASVPDIAPEAVTILDQRGVTLSRTPEPEGPQASVSARFQAKSEIETYLTRKVVAVLDRAFGPGKAIVSVDVTVNHDHVKVTAEDVIPLGERGTEPVGALVRRRVTTQSAPGGAERAADAPASASAASSTTEAEYQSGRRVEQVVSEPGSIRRISVGVMLPHPLDKAKVDEIRQVIAMAVGLDTGRGDDIALSFIDQFAPAAPEPAVPAVTEMPPPIKPAASAPGDVRRVPSAFEWLGIPEIGVALLAAALLLAVVVAVLGIRRERAQRQLDPRERERLLENIRDWMRAESAPEPRERAP